MKPVPTTTLRLFVYGTLKPGGCYYREYCAGRTSMEQPAQTRGRLTHLSAGYPALLEGTDWVQGHLLEFTEATENVLAAIDRLEDYDPARLAVHNEYQRITIPIYDANLNSLGTAWTYIMTEEKATTLGAVYLPTGEWDQRTAPAVTHPPLLERIRQ